MRQKTAQSPSVRSEASFNPACVFLHSLFPTVLISDQDQNVIDHQISKSFQQAFSCGAKSIMCWWLSRNNSPSSASQSKQGHSESFQANQRDKTVLYIACRWLGTHARPLPPDSPPCPSGFSRPRGRRVGSLPAHCRLPGTPLESQESK